MNRSFDLALRRLLKNWASHSNPPEDGRARLLWEAAHVAKKKPFVIPFIFQYPSHEHSARRANEWSQVFMAWTIETTLQSGMSLRIC